MLRAAISCEEILDRLLFVTITAISRPLEVVFWKSSVRSRLWPLDLIITNFAMPGLLVRSEWSSNLRLQLRLSQWGRWWITFAGDRRTVRLNRAQFAMSVRQVHHIPTKITKPNDYPQWLSSMTKHTVTIHIHIRAFIKIAIRRTSDAPNRPSF